jgi:hypothetical protein
MLLIFSAHVNDTTSVPHNKVDCFLAALETDHTRTIPSVEEL